MPAVVAGLHSQLAAIAVAIKHTRPAARLAYVMTDGAALPLALSDLVAALRDRASLDATITCGHAFGGDHEAVSVYSALGRRPSRIADAAIVVHGPGHRRHREPARLQRASRSGRSSTPSTGLGGVPIACAARVVRRPARTPPRRLAPQRDRAHARDACAHGADPVAGVGGDEARRARRSRAICRRDARDRRRPHGRHHRPLRRARPARRVDGTARRPTIPLLFECRGRRGRRRREPDAP